jgi:hypothetical protein
MLRTCKGRAEFGDGGHQRGSEHDAVMCFCALATAGGLQEKAASQVRGRERMHKKTPGYLGGAYG